MSNYICEVSPHSVTVYDNDDGHADQIIGVFVCNEDIRWAERKTILEEIGRLIEGKSYGTED